MATDIVKNYKANLVAFQNNPTQTHALGLQLVRDSSNGLYDIVDCTNPWVALMEASAHSVSAAMEKMDVVNRKMYPIASQVIEDLYPHMSDKDMSDRFATPSETTFIMVIAMEELANNLVMDPTTGNSKVVIPAHTNFTLGGITFSMQYPIVITRMAHGDYTVLYDVSNPSPLLELETNVVPVDVQQTPAFEQFMALTLDVKQFNIVTQQGDLNQAQEFVTVVSFTDQFYYCRVYFGSVDTGWTEMTTTHTSDVYDVSVPTAVLMVIDGGVVVKVPQIYVTKGLVSNKIRVDVYQTKGPLAVNLSDYPIDAAVVQFLTLDKSEDTIFTAPLKNFRQLHAFSPYTSTGGTNALTFDQLKTRMIDGTMGLNNRVITNVELPTVLETKGYSIVANYDLLTNRVFLATREMPIPTNEKLITAAASSIVTMAAKVSDLIALSAVKNNGTSITITPDVIYQTVGGATSFVSDSALAQVLALAPEQRALVVTNGGYYYTPFHYVLDMNNSEFALRPYYLDKPTVRSKSYVAENDTTLLSVATDTYSITRVPTGYRLSIVTKSSDDFKALNDEDVYVQLAYVPAGEKDLAYLNGTLAAKSADNERVFNFDLTTNFNVDADDNIEFTKFTMFTTEPRITGAQLTTTFQIFYAVGSVMGPKWVPNGVDRSLGNYLLPNRIAAVANETLKINFGTSLKTLWSRARSVVESVGYKTWDVDVLEYYTEDVYQRDANGSIIQIVDGKVVTNKLHSKGDPVIDPATGLQVVKFAKGSVMLDESGNPIPGSSDGLERQFDIMLIDGTYWFATDTVSGGYRQELTNTIVGWMSGDLDAISKRLLEQTKLYFYPKVNTGYMDVMIEDGSIISMPANQSFQIDYVVTEQVNANESLKKRLGTLGIQTLYAALSNTTYSPDAVQDTLRGLCGNDILGVTVSGMGGAKNYKFVEVVDDSNRFSLHKRLVAQTDETLIVQEDVIINFIPHVKKK